MLRTANLILAALLLFAGPGLGWPGQAEETPADHGLKDLDDLAHRERDEEPMALSVEGRQRVIHEVYTGGMGVTAAEKNLEQYLKLFDGTDYGPTAALVGTGGDGRLWVKDPAAFERRIRYPFDKFGLGVRVGITFYRIPQADQGINSGKADKYLTALGQILRRLRDDGCPYIAITPFAETIGMHTGLGKRLGGTSKAAITIDRANPDGSHFRAAFQRVVEKIRAEVEVDLVVLHFNSTDRRAIKEYAPDPAYWDSYGITVAKAKNGQPAKVYRELWRTLQALGFGDKTLAFPEWKVADGGGVTDDSQWRLIGQVFDLIDSGDVPISLLSWNNKDPAQKTWGYPELRWQKASRSNREKWLAAWARVKD